MKIEIWSDVTCIHCYTAKRKFETAMLQFKDKDKLDITWRSFELAPGFKTDPHKFLPQFLKELHGVSMEQVQGMVDQATNSVREVGLVFNLDKAIPANTFNAHRLSHFAKTQGLQEEMKERMFKAYFIEGKNMDDIPTLVELTTEIGLNVTEVKEILEGTRFTEEVNEDLNEARQTGIVGVPAYVFNKNKKVLGVQDSRVYLELLETEFTRWQTERLTTVSEIIDGKSCKIGEECN